MDLLVDIRLAGHVRRRIAGKIGFNALWTKVASGDASVSSPDLEMTGRGMPLPQWTACHSHNGPVIPFGLVRSSVFDGTSDATAVDPKIPIVKTSPTISGITACGRAMDYPKEKFYTYRLCRKNMMLS